MVKINNKRNLKYYLKDYDSGNSSQKSAAKALGITPRRFRQIHEIYKSTGEIPARIETICVEAIAIVANQFKRGIH